MRMNLQNVAIGILLAAPCGAATAQDANSNAPSPATSNKGGVGLGLTAVPSAQPRLANTASPNVLAPELIETIAVQGSQPLENPTASISHYGFHADGPLVPGYGDVQSTTHNVEATKSEPDKNTYLVLDNQKGADPNYHYGTHFLFQGHELCHTRPNVAAAVPGAPSCARRSSRGADAKSRVRASSPRRGVIAMWRVRNNAVFS
jgi:hypothetical protein